MTIRKMVTLRHAHLPSILMNCILSLLYCCSLATAGVVNPTAGEGCRQIPRASLLWLERYVVLFFFPSNICPTEEKQEAEDDHIKINAWQVTQSKLFDI